MDSINRLNETKKRLADIYITDSEKIKRLQVLLSVQLNREVSYDEAKQLGTELICYYQSLAGTRQLTVDSSEGTVSS